METERLGGESSSTNWCLKKQQTLTCNRSTPAGEADKLPPTYPTTFSSEKKTSPKAAKSLDYGLFPTSWSYSDHSFYLQFIWTKIWEEISLSLPGQGLLASVFSPSIKLDSTVPSCELLQ